MEGRGRKTAGPRPAGGAAGRRKAALLARAACLEASHPVSRKTMLLMLKPEFFDRVSEAEYRFCRLPECDIVYFNGSDGPCFTTEQLRLPVALKGRDDRAPLCYCFHFSERDLQEEVARTGETTIPHRIRNLITQGMCACATRNPSGACCLGEVTRTAQRLLRECARGGAEGDSTQ